MARISIPNSSYLDLTSYGQTTATTVEAAYDLGPPVPSQTTLNVALILPRANDPTALLNGNWASRQAALAQLDNSGTLWTTYGASQMTFDATKAVLDHLHIPILGDAAGADGYVTSAESRTIWVRLSPDKFTELFDRTLYGAGPYLQYWHGDLTVPDTIDVAGIWFDAPPIYGTFPAASDMSGGVIADLKDGYLGIGNGLASTGPSLDYAGNVGQWFYNFPLAGKDMQTPTIGLVEPLIGDAIAPDATWTFQEGLNSFRQSAGVGGPGSYYTVAHNGQSFTNGNSIERSLDVGVVASAAPGSQIGLYAGSGDQNNATGNAYTAYQAAFHDAVHMPSVVSSSFGIFQQTNPISIFRTAVDELFVDAALNNITTFVANNDWGSSYGFPNGLANQNITLSSPYAVLVGGTSLTTLAAASGDPTIYDPTNPSASLLGKALAHDPGTLWLLIEGGLATMPTKVTGTQGEETTFLEAGWNVYALGENQTQLDPGLNSEAGGAGDGGVDTTRPVPGYQLAFGLTPTSANPDGGSGRGAPDVSANAGGNMWFQGPRSTMKPDVIGKYWGTSASSPLWASLAAQIDAVFNDQGLPNLGYANDLFYEAAAIAPASFNDIVFGNNASSYLDGGPINSDGTSITLTGFGYNAAPGYDLTTGLGTPNGLLLARSLTAIAQQQMFFGSVPDVVTQTASGGWQSGAKQSLLVQATLPNGSGTVSVTGGKRSLKLASDQSSPFAWTSRLAGQVEQSFFDDDLVRLFDMGTQGALGQIDVDTNDPISLLINGVDARGLAPLLTSAAGFADFQTPDGSVRLARPVAVAETADGGNNEEAILRLRQDGGDSTSVAIYRVDDLAGDIGTLSPGDPGYAAAAEARAYQLASGGIWLGSPGNGKYGQTMLKGVNAGDIVAMELVNNTHGNNFWAFAQANELVDGQYVGHLWNYGMNTWGWEDTYGGGDRDYNDLVVQIDFTSNAGHGWIK